MRTGHWLSAPALLLFTSSLAVTYRQDALAEQQFKNIKVLKGKKASDVIPSMEFMCASLKVSCDYCHAADRASDEKDAKDRAREMIVMQNDINEKNFGGRTQVTCATCHAGHTHPVNVPPIPGVETRPRRAPADITPEKILADYAKAAGSKAPESLELQGEAEMMGKKVQIREVHSGGKFFVDTKQPTGDQKIGFNGTATWYGTPKGTQVIPSQYATTFINENSLVLGPDSLPKLANPSAGTAKILDRDMLVVSGTVEGSRDRVSIYFDKATSLPARIAYSYPTILGNIPQINDYSAYRTVNGVPVPMVVARHSSEGDSVLHFRSARVNGKIEDGLFDPAK